MSETTRAKSIRLIIEKRVRIRAEIPRRGQDVGLLLADVRGDSGDYETLVSEISEQCSCPARVKRCSHVLAVSSLREAVRLVRATGARVTYPDEPESTTSIEGSEE